jgi:hypothetical protein
VGAQVTPDGLSLYYSGNDDLMVARRAVRGATWDPPQPLVQLNSAIADSDPTPSADELEIYFARRDMNNFSCLYTSTRPATTMPWSVPTQMASFCPSMQADGPYLTPDGLTLLYTQKALLATEGTLMISTRASKADVFMPGAPVDISPPSPIGYPVLSADQLTLYFEADATSMLELYQATRPDRGSAFGNITPLPFNLAAAVDEDVSITGDGLELYFDSDRLTLGSATALFVVTRSCL